MKINLGEIFDNFLCKVFKTVEKSSFEKLPKLKK